MDRIQNILREIIHQRKLMRRRTGSLHTIAVDLTEDGVMFSFSNGRKQLIRIVQQGEHYRLMSVILKQKSVEKIGHARLLSLIWQRNRETNLVSFNLDDKNRLVGSIEQLSQSADADEMLHYLERLARECDQLEYLLSGLEES